jgi:hypothetical protein
MSKWPYVASLAAAGAGPMHNPPGVPYALRISGAPGHCLRQSSAVKFQTGPCFCVWVRVRARVHLQQAAFSLRRRTSIPLVRCAAIVCLQAATMAVAGKGKSCG